MANTKLKEALQNCLISFDRRVLVTDLLEEYALPYAEVHQTLEQHIQQQEAKEGTKYKKRFLVHGEEKDDSHKQIYTVVQGEAKLKEWLAKLKNAESSLYSVEVAGGAKAPAQIFKPMRSCAVKLKNLEIRKGAAKTNGNANGTASAPVKVETKPQIKSEAPKAIAIASRNFKKPTEPTASTSSKAETTNKNQKISPETKKSTPEEKKSAQKSIAAKNQKGIGNFFTAGAKKDDAKKATNATGVVKPPTPKKMQDFFKKQTQKTPTKSPKKETAANTSMQLFAADDDDEVEACNIESSDEEEKIEALKRDIITSDHEEEEAASTLTASKRRRILDSDEDEDEPQKKQEKKELPEDNEKEHEAIELDDDEQTAPASETFLDDEGFVITVKPKLKPRSNKIAKPKKTEKAPFKSPPKSTGAIKQARNSEPAPKIKQGNIMSFFTKK